MVDADVGEQDAVVGQDGAQVGQHALRAGAARRPERRCGATCASHSRLHSSISARQRACGARRPRPRPRRSALELAEDVLGVGRERRARLGSCGRARPGRCRRGSAASAGSSRCSPAATSSSTRSSKRVPRARITSALRVARLAVSVPLRPVAPRLSGERGSNTPLPSGVCATGMPTAPANRASSPLASPSSTPWPATITGRSAASSRSSARSTSSSRAAAPSEIPPCHAPGSGTSASVLLDEHVQRDVEVDGPGPAGEHGREGLAEHQRQLVGPRGLVAALDVRPDDAREVGLEVAPGLLERPAVELARRHVAGDGEQRRRSPSAPSPGPRGGSPTPGRTT